MVEYFGQQLEGFCFTGPRLGAELWQPLRQAARPLWRRVRKAANDRLMARLCTEPHPKTHEGYAHRAGDYPVLELCA